MPDDVLYRSFAADIEEGDGRTLHGRLVPYGEPATVQDRGLPYREMFAVGAFAKDVGLARSPHRVRLHALHRREGISDWLGRGVAFDERDDGLYGTFAVTDSAFGNHALALVKDESLRYFSIGFESKKARPENGVMVRVGCRLREASLVDEPAYKGTKVEVRHAVAVELEELRPARNEDLDRRLGVLGFRQE